MQYCGGRMRAEVRYCLPDTDDDQSDWVATNSKLYVAGAKLEAGATNTWLVEMGVDPNLPNTKSLVSRSSSLPRNQGCSKSACTTAK